MNNNKLTQGYIGRRPRNGKNGPNTINLFHETLSFLLFLHSSFLCFFLSFLTSKPLSKRFKQIQNVQKESKEPRKPESIKVEERGERLQVVTEFYTCMCKKCRSVTMRGGNKNIKTKNVKLYLERKELNNLKKKTKKRMP